MAKGWKDVVADPAAGVAMLAKRNPAADAALETRRLRLAIDANVLKEYVRATGLGGVDAARFDRWLMQPREILNSIIRLMPRYISPMPTSRIPATGCCSRLQLTRRRAGQAAPIVGVMQRTAK